MERSVRWYTRACVVLGAAVASTMVAAPALAHGEEEHGELTVVLGFMEEPAYAGEPNGAEVTLTSDGEPVTDVRAGDLTVEVTLGGQSSELDLVPNFEVGAWGEPGNYVAPFIPSEPGAYTFHVTGTVDGEEIDLEMTGGPDTFSEVEDPADASFPQVASGPSGDDVIARIEAEGERVAAAGAAAEEARAAAADAQDQMASAQTFAVAGIVIGATGLLVAIVALFSRRRSA